MTSVQRLVTPLFYRVENDGAGGNSPEKKEKGEVVALADLETPSRQRPARNSAAGPGIRSPAILVSRQQDRERRGVGVTTPPSSTPPTTMKSPLLQGSFSMRLPPPVRPTVSLMPGLGTSGQRFSPRLHSGFATVVHSERAPSPSEGRSDKFHTIWRGAGDTLERQTNPTAAASLVERQTTPKPGSQSSKLLTEVEAPSPDSITTTRLAFSPSPLRPRWSEAAVQIQVRPPIVDKVKLPAWTFDQVPGVDLPKDAGVADRALPLREDQSERPGSTYAASYSSLPASRMSSSATQGFTFPGAFAYPTSSTGYLSAAVSPRLRITSPRSVISAPSSISATPPTRPWAFGQGNARQVRVQSTMFQPAPQTLPTSSRLGRVSEISSAAPAACGPTSPRDFSAVQASSDQSRLQAASPIVMSSRDPSTSRRRFLV